MTLHDKRRSYIPSEAQLARSHWAYINTRLRLSEYFERAPHASFGHHTVFGHRLHLRSHRAGHVNCIACGALGDLSPQAVTSKEKP